MRLVGYRKYVQMKPTAKSG